MHTHARAHSHTPTHTQARGARRNAHSPSTPIATHSAPGSPGDDFLDYEDDITAGGGGSFNLLRCFVHLHGEGAPLTLARRISELEGERERLLAALPTKQRSFLRRRQVEAAEGEGEGALRWQVPPLVLDEAAFRRQFG